MCKSWSVSGLNSSVSGRSPTVVHSRPGSGYICHHLVIGVHETKITMITIAKVTPIMPKPTKILLRYFDLSWGNVSRELC